MTITATVYTNMTTLNVSDNFPSIFHRDEESPSEFHREENPLQFYREEQNPAQFHRDAFTTPTEKNIRDKFRPNPYSQKIKE